MNNPLHTQHQQQGLSLLVSLIMLVVITLIVLSAMTNSSLNLKIIGNMQTQGEAIAAAQQAIEDKISSKNFFYSAPSANSQVQVDINGDGVSDYTTVVAPPACLESKIAKGYSATFAASAPRDTVWEVSASVTQDGTAVNVHQGVKMRMETGAVCAN